MVTLSVLWEYSILQSVWKTGYQAWWDNLLMLAKSQTKIVSFDGLSESFHVPDSMNHSELKAERSTLKVQRVKRNAHRISTVAEGEQN